jgi:endonuclease/exonuclease/phosphatase family metal-dependent hydrolase
MISFFKKILFLKFILIAVVFGQDTLKMMTWNLLGFNHTQAITTARYPSYRRVIHAVDPDILCVQEVSSGSVGLNSLLADIVNYDLPSGTYATGGFYDGPDTDNAFFYKPSKVQILSAQIITNSPRYMNRITVRDIKTGDTLHCFIVHPKAGNTTADMTARGQEIDILRSVTNTYHGGVNFLVCGDFNIYNSSEPAYQKLIAQSPGLYGHVVDPISMPVPSNWNNSANAVYHTQSTRTTVLSDGGANGGLDDRFDMILNSSALTAAGGMTYLSGSCRAYGNDGLHYNLDINNPANAIVPDSIAKALYTASDHLPVVASYVCEGSSSVDNDVSTPERIELCQNYPNPFNAGTVFRFSLNRSQYVTLAVFDLLGRCIGTPVAGYMTSGYHNVQWNPSDIATGIYMYRLQVGNLSFTRHLLQLK